MRSKVWLIVGVGLIAFTGYAGEFQVSCFSNLGGCSARVKNVVTDKFTRHYPASRYEIVVLAEFQPYSDGGGVGYAVAGVSPVLRDGTTQFPVRRYASTVRIVDRSMSAFDVTRETEMVMRDAVEQLMAACDRSTNCDVYRLKE